MRCNARTRLEKVSKIALGLIFKANTRTVHEEATTQTVQDNHILPTLLTWEDRTKTRQTRNRRSLGLWKCTDHARCAVFPALSPSCRSSLSDSRLWKWEKGNQQKAQVLQSAQPFERNASFATVVSRTKRRLRCPPGAAEAHAEALRLLRLFRVHVAQLLVLLLLLHAQVLIRQPHRCPKHTSQLPSTPCTASGTPVGIYCRT